MKPNIRSATALLLATTALVFTAAPAWADATAPCNVDAGPDAIIGTADDGLECGVNSDAPGNSATAVGNGANAQNDAAIAIGRSSNAIANYSIAIGFRSSTFDETENGTNYGQIAIGMFAAANGNRATAVGMNARADEQRATSLGSDTKAMGESVAVGSGAKAGDAFSSGDFFAVAVGASSLAGGEAVAMGYDAVSIAASVAVGSRSVAALQGIAIGADGDDADLIGASSGIQAVAIGTDADANGQESIAIGQETKAFAADSAAIGPRAYVDTGGTGSVVLGGGAYTDEAYVVSVGSAFQRRRITNVANGSASNDAVNVAQLANAIAAIKPGSPYVAVNSTEAPAMATGGNATAVGPQSHAAGARSLALGQLATTGANATDASAIGARALANGLNATAVGRVAIAGGTNSTAVGSGAEAKGAGASSFGLAAKANANRTTAVGRLASASNADATAVGHQATASGVGSTAIGDGATAGFSSSTAIGSGATATRSNQVALGGTGSSVKVADIDASTAAQVGPVDAVTVDANGVLGRQQVATASAVRTVAVAVDHIAAISEAQFDSLSGRVGTLETGLSNLSFQLDELDQSMTGGIAAAMAMGGAQIVPGKAISLTVAGSTYKGEQAFAGSVTGRITDSVYLSASVGGNTGDDAVGGRVAATFGF